LDLKVLVKRTSLFLGGELWGGELTKSINAKKRGGKKAIPWRGRGNSFPSQVEERGVEIVLSLFGKGSLGPFTKEKTLG